MTKNIKWTREELILSMAYYLKYRYYGKLPPFEIEKLSTLLRTYHKHKGEILDKQTRSLRSISARHDNFKYIDPINSTHNKGLSGGENTVKPIWDEFYTNRTRLFKLAKHIENDLIDLYIDTTK